MSTTNEQLYFYKGLEADLPKSGIKTGALYHCTDTGNTYRGIDATTLELYSTRVGKKISNGGEIFNNYTNNVANGENSHAEGNKTIAEGNASHAEGGNIDTNGAATDWTFEFDDPSGLGPQTFEITGPYAYGNGAHAEGLSTLAYGAGAHSEGLCTLAAGGRSHAEGTGTQALGHRAHAEGGNTTASGKDSHAEGTNTIASGSAAHAEGQNTIALGTYSHVEGTVSIAAGPHTHAEGGSTEARGMYSHAEGWHTIAHQYQHVQGKYNAIDGQITTSTKSQTLKAGSGDNAYIYFETATPVENDCRFIMTNQTGPFRNPPDSIGILFTQVKYLCGNDSTIQYYEFKETPTIAENGAGTGKTTTTKFKFVDYAHVIGNGSGTARSNAHTVDWNGNGWFAGDVTVGEDKQKLTTESAVNALIDTAISKIDYTPILQDYATENYVNDKAKAHYVVAGRKAETIVGERSTAEGKDTTASSYSAHAEGYTTSAKGRASHAEGGYAETDAAAEYAHAEGNSTLASGLAAHAEGKGTVASGRYSHAEGRSDDKTLYMAFGEASHIEGVNTKAVGVGAHAEGVNTIAQGQASHAEGDSISGYKDTILQNRIAPQAISRASHAEGVGTIAGTANAINKIQTFAAHAEGIGSQALHVASHAEGMDTKAEGKYSHTEGLGTIAQGDAQHVEGKYNSPLDNTYIHIVGNGTSDTSRSNAHTIDINGNAWFAGDIYTSESEQKLATEEYADKSNAPLIVTVTAEIDEETEETMYHANHTGVEISEYTKTTGAVLLDCDAFEHRNTEYVPLYSLDGDIARFDVATNDYVCCVSILSDGEVQIKPKEYMVNSIDLHTDVHTFITIKSEDNGRGDTISFGCDGVDNPVVLHNIADGTASNDAINKAQLDAAIETIGTNAKTPLIVTLTVETNEDTGEPMYKASHNGIEITKYACNDGLVILDCYGLADYISIPGYVTLSTIEEEIPYFNIQRSADTLITIWIDGFGEAFVEETSSSITPKNLVGKKTAENGEIFNDYVNNQAFAYSHAEGYSTKANEGGHAEGYYTQALGNSSHAEGYETKATAMRSHAEGEGSEAYGAWSHAEGHNTKTTYDAAHAEGTGTIAEGYSSHAEGFYSESSGSWSHAEGEFTIASGHASHAEGNRTNAIGLHSHAQGYQTTSYGGESAAMGFSHNLISQDVLDNSQVDEDGNFIMKTDELERWKANRFETTSDGDYSTGFNSLYSLAGGSFSTSEGLDTLALGRSSHSEGNYTIASGMASHAEGSKTEANGFTAHAEGEWTIANSRSSHAEGLGTIANAPGQHAQGKYNIVMDSNYLHIVGNGTSDTERSNAHTIDKNGNAWFAGGITADGTNSLNIGKNNTTYRFTVNGSNGNTSVGGTLTVAGETILNGNVTLGNSNSISTGDTLTVNTKSATFGGTLTITGATTLSSKLTVKGNTILGDSTNDTITCNGPTTCNSALTLNGILQLDDEVSEDVGTYGTTLPTTNLTKGRIFFKKA